EAGRARHGRADRIAGHARPRIAGGAAADHRAVSAAVAGWLSRDESGLPCRSDVSRDLTDTRFRRAIATYVAPTAASADAVRSAALHPIPPVAAVCPHRSSVHDGARH